MSALLKGHWRGPAIYLLWRIIQFSLLILALMQTAADRHMSPQAVLLAKDGGFFGPNLYLPVISLTLFIVLPLNRPLAALVQSRSADTVWRAQLALNTTVAVITALIMTGAGVIFDPLTSDMRAGWLDPLTLISEGLGIAIWSWLYLFAAQRVMLNYPLYRRYVQGGVYALLLVMLLSAITRNQGFDIFSLFDFLAADAWLIPVTGFLVAIPVILRRRSRPLRILPAA